MQSIMNKCVQFILIRLDKCTFWGYGAYISELCVILKTKNEQYKPQ